MAEDKRTCLHVCVTCRDGGAGLAAEGGARAKPAGRALYEAAREIVAEDDPELAIRPVVCLANCDRGCSATASAPGKWAYMLGGLGPALAEDLVAYGRAFAASATGAVLRAGRPTSLHHAIIGRFPGQFSGLEAQVAQFTENLSKEAAE